MAVRASLRSVLEHVTLDQIVKGKFPEKIQRLTRDPDAWKPH